jgi:hypothetical protein
MEAIGCCCFFDQSRANLGDQELAIGVNYHRGTAAHLDHRSFRSLTNCQPPQGMIGDIFRGYHQVVV